MLRSLDLTVPAGRITTLIGPSGCGKTTLIKHVLGLLQPDQGTVTIGDCDVWDCTPGALFAVRGSMSVLHSGSSIYLPSLDASRSIRDNLQAVLWHKAHAAERVSPGANPFQGLWAPHHRAGSRSDVQDTDLRNRAEEWMERFALGRFADMLPDEVGARTRRRVAVAKALVADAPLYVLDDPDTAVDAPNVEAIVGAVLDAQRRTGATMLVATHDLALVERISDHVAVLANGRIVTQGEPEVVLAGVEEWYEFDHRYRAADIVGPPRLEDVRRNDEKNRHVYFAVPDPQTVAILVLGVLAVIMSLVMAEAIG